MRHLDRDRDRDRGRNRDKDRDTAEATIGFPRSHTLIDRLLLPVLLAEVAVVTENEAAVQQTHINPLCLLLCFRPVPVVSKSGRSSKEQRGSEACARGRSSSFRTTFLILILILILIHRAAAAVIGRRTNIEYAP